MKRMLSWITLIVGMLLFYFLEALYWYLLFYIYGKILEFSEGLFWVVILFGGAMGFGILLTGAALLGNGSIFLSQKIRRSSHGVRYIVSAILYVFYCALGIYIRAAGLVISGNALIVYFVQITMIVFCVYIAISGYLQAKEDGGPPSKRERLEAKKAKIEQKLDSMQERTYVIVDKETGEIVGEEKRQRPKAPATRNSITQPSVRAEDRSTNSVSIAAQSVPMEDIRRRTFIEDTLIPNMFYNKPLVSIGNLISSKEQYLANIYNTNIETYGLPSKQYRPEDFKVWVIRKEDSLIAIIRPPKPLVPPHCMYIAADFSSNGDHCGRYITVELTDDGGVFFCSTTPGGDRSILSIHATTPDEIITNLFQLFGLKATNAVDT